MIRITYTETTRTVVVEHTDPDGASAVREGADHDAPPSRPTFPGAPAERLPRPSHLQLVRRAA